MIKSICWTTDIDYFLHMNNAKYLKELDFARFDYYFRTGLWELFKTYPGTVTNAFVFFTYRLCRLNAKLKFKKRFTGRDRDENVPEEN